MKLKLLGSGTTLTIGLPNDVTISENLTVNGSTTLGNDITNGGDTVPLFLWFPYRICY